ncbi:MAG TPA: AAA family ATPase [Longimicrobium sp.]|nr:AAA family ATPase [Longimicrobium sp.]
MSAPLIRRLTLNNFLSFGPDGVSVDLRPLNVLIGPNASGKSNLLESLAILRATAGDLQAAVREGGGIGEYLWKGRRTSPSGSLHALLSEPKPSLTDVISHSIELARVGTKFEVAAEVISARRFGSRPDFFVRPLYEHRDTAATVVARLDDDTRDLAVLDLKPGQSVLSQRRDPDLYPELTFLADQFGSIALFREWNFGARSLPRMPQPTDLPSDFLRSDASNLGLVLHDLWQTSVKREELIGFLSKFYEPARFISTKIQGGTIQLYIEEVGGRLIPATRLSDGTLRYLCLLAILCHPNPPPVIGIEEPELGLHPDIIPTIAELLRKASERTQLFVTTHSDTLVSALSDVPESILVCEATPDGTTMRRLEAEPLREWLEKYSLGELWRMGEIGGNRW